jgi:uncharacterized protein YPO0396
LQNRAHTSVADLPRFEAQFKTLLNQNTIREVAGFQTPVGGEFMRVVQTVLNELPPMGFGL